jgi:hypothetical protein
VIYSDDKEVKQLAVDAKIAAVGISELPLPPQKTQSEMFPVPAPALPAPGRKEE